ncbi:MAG: transferase [Bacteroidaceae bacterium]|nr:transferase [Bacteroidaceae bacterium]
MKKEKYSIISDSKAEEIVVPIPESYKDVAELIKSDFYRRSGKMVPVWKIYLQTLKTPTLAASFWARVSAHQGGWLRLMAKFALRHYRLHYGISFNSKRVGYGLYIGHEYLRVSVHTVIGNNVNLSHFTTIGTNAKQGATIGNNVYIGPNVCVVDKVSIGSNVTIGAGTIVVKDLLADSTYVGNPARRVGPNKHSEYIVNPYPIDQ